MSIINEALKKVQSDLKGKESSPATPEVPLEQTTIAAAVTKKPEPPPPPPPSDIQKAIRQENPEVIEKPDAKLKAPASHVFTNLFKKPKPVIKPKPVLSAEKLRKERILTAISALLCVVLLICIGALLTQFMKIHGPKGVINGIMEEQGKKVVLIDNEIYEVGDTYQGAKVVGISIDKVQFLEKGIIRTVKVKNKNTQIKK